MDSRKNSEREEQNLSILNSLAKKEARAKLTRIENHFFNNFSRDFMLKTVLNIE